MSGFPPIQIFLLCVAFAILAIPVTQLTSGPAAPPKHAAKQAASGDVVSSFVRLRYAHKPLSVSLKMAGKELLDHPDLVTSPAEARAAIPAGNKKVEMILTATWPAGTPDTALTVELEPDGLDARSETRWSANAQLSEVLTFQW